MINSRSKNATLNIIVGFVAQLGILLLSFVGRRIFVQFLSEDYLGINGLYGNILSVLALAELGLGNVTQFFLYKPVVENDYDKIRSLMRFFNKAYTIIAFAVLGLGLAVIPLLPLIVNSDLGQGELIIYYVIFLVNSCISYFAASKTALLLANQNNRVSKYVTLSVNLVLQLAHIAVLYIWHNYTAYILATLISTIATVLLTNFIAGKYYPYLKEKSFDDTEIDRKYILNNVKSTFVYKIGATIVNNTGNILISIMISTAAVGLYSNYFMVVSGIQGFISIITVALVSGVGNLSASGNKSRMLSVFYFMLLFYNFIAAFGGISFMLLFDDLIPIWVGEKFLLDAPTTFAIALAFYFTNAVSPIWMFRESNGLFESVKYLLLVTAVCNIVLSIVLGYFFGMFGILLATTLSRILTQVWYEPKILFKKLFCKSTAVYWFKQIKYFALTIISAALCYLVNMALPHSFLFIIIKGIIFFVICALVFFLACFKTEEGKETKYRICRIFDKLKKGDHKNESVQG